MSTKGEAVFVTGSSSGIGGGGARCLSDRGRNVVVNDALSAGAANVVVVDCLVVVGSVWSTLYYKARWHTLLDFFDV